MASPNVERKLAAILCADVAGYSRLMAADEEATIETLTAYRKVFLAHIGTHRGRVVDAKGDAILAEFASVVDAVSGAVEIQRGLAEKNSELPDDRRMDFRIGINLGDVVVKDDVIYGDGVNIAARVESLAEGGGICISGSVYAQVRNKLKLEYEFLGKKEVKNIAEPVPVYRIGMEEGAQATQKDIPPEERLVFPPKQAPSLKLPDRPSLAVLPFVNMSGDPEQEYFSDGITEDLITDLSRLPRLFVIASNSVFTYKGKPTDVRRVGEELGVRYVLEGSVRKAGNRVRINAQLVDAASGEHLWARRYDRELHDIFALQDEISRDIATELEVKLVEGEQARVWRSTTSDLEAYDLALRGRELYRRYNRADHARGRRLIEKALELDPGYTYAIVLLGWTYYVEGTSGWSKSSQACFDRAVELGNQALALNDALGDAYALLSVAYRYKGEYDRGLEYGERGVNLNPDDADSNAVFAGLLVRAGRGEDALERIEIAWRLNPLPPNWYLNVLGGAYRSLERFEEAIAVFRECVERSADEMGGNFGLTLSYMLAGREKEGRAQARHVLRINPDFSSSSEPYVTSYKDPATRERYATLLRKAGLPD